MVLEQVAVRCIEIIRMPLSGVVFRQRRSSLG
jgi:hypothetical protein